MRSFILFLLLLWTRPLFGQSIPAGYPAQQRLLMEAANREKPRMDSLLHLARKAGNRDFARLVELHAAYSEVGQPGRSPAGVQERLYQWYQVFRNSGDRTLEAVALTYLSRCYWVYGAHEKSLTYGLMAHQLYSDKAPEAFPLKHFALYELGSTFFTYRDYPTAIQYLKASASIRDSGIAPGPGIALNSLGLCYRHLKRYDSALVCFQEALRFVSGPEDVWNGILKGNIASVLEEQGQLAEAIPLYQEDIERSLRNNAALDNAAYSMACLGDIYRRQGRMMDAEPLMQRSWALVEQEGFRNQYRLMAEICPRMARFHQAKKDLGKAARFWEIAAQSRDSIEQQNHAQLLAGVQLKVNASQYLARQQELEGEVAMQVLARNSLLVGVVLLTAIALLFIRYQRARHQFRQQQTAAELTAASRQLDAFTRTLHEKNELLERFRAELDRAAPFSAAVEDPDTLAELRGLTILTEEEWSYFQSLFEKVHAGFIERLTTKIPGLTAGDVRYVVLTKVQLSNKEIGAALGISPGSVRSIRSRLRKRLGLREEDALEAVIAAI